MTIWKSYIDNKRSYFDQITKLYWQWSHPMFRERVTNTSQHEVNVLHLKPNTDYTFWVTAFNRYGGSLVPAQITVKTEEEGEMVFTLFTVL